MIKKFNGFLYENKNIRVSKKTIEKHYDNQVSGSDRIYEVDKLIQELKGIGSRRKVCDLVWQIINSVNKTEHLLNALNIKNYTINPDGFVDVQGSVSLYGYKISKLPLEFGNVRGHFYCDFVGLTTLENCPKEVGGYFSCEYNKINTLEGCPKEVGGDFYFRWNHNLTSLEGLEDTIVLGEIIAYGCESLYSLDGFPIDFKGEFYCSNTPIETIYVRYIEGAYIEGTNQLAQAIQFFNQLQVIEEGSYGWEISYRKLLEYLKRYKEFGKPTKEEVQELIGDKYIVR